MNTAATCILIIIVSVSISISYLTSQRDDQYVVSILSQSTLLDEFELEQEKRRKILKRGCRVAGDLDQLSKNGTAYETLIAVHRRIHNLRNSKRSPERLFRKLNLSLKMGNGYHPYEANYFGVQ